MSAIEHLIATENLQASVIEWLRSSESFHKRTTNHRTLNPDGVSLASVDSSLKSSEGATFKRRSDVRGFIGSNALRRNGSSKLPSTIPKREGYNRSYSRAPRRSPQSQIGSGSEKCVSSIEELTEKMQMIFAPEKADETASLKQHLIVRTSSLEDDNRSDFSSSRLSDAASNQLKFKTRMCKAFAATGFCRYGNACTFAHFEKEKRKDISTIYKFKTDMCNAWLRGTCAFGSACHFGHGPSDLVTNTL